ncbi:uncharacterized protein TNIN_141521 [Trichonephila inaurata madagascariensis]|uniref:Uncharacterized protein n=1 Tax=Trichonephila inaurata madagascariensis TaxID=2747483 RepID=A0A8X7CJ74_9ARAC|nr:uncharacterized protein TNIN_141521 [Trichonephila inaurata madagascariensis]
MGTQIVPPAGRGTFCFRIHGQIYHRTSHLHPAQAGEEKFAQLYVLDSEVATCREAFLGFSPPKKHLFTKMKFTDYHTLERSFN